MTAKTANTFPHWIFGYGSLICPSSRAVTAPSLQGRRSTPVLVRHLERLWSFPIPECGQTFMGIRRQPQAQAVGVLVPVSDDELAQFDMRELGYERVSVSHKDVERIPFLVEDDDRAGHSGGNENKQQHYGSSDDFVCYFDQVKMAGSTISDRLQAQHSPNQNNDINVWVYVQQAPAPIQCDAPIAQSYLDVILRGCLTISKQFAHHFIETTRGWSVGDFDGGRNYVCVVGQQSGTNEKQKRDVVSQQDGETSLTAMSSSATSANGVETEHPRTFWVDDRKNPLYVRADPDFSNKFGHELDDLLKTLRPAEMHHRYTRA